MGKKKKVSTQPNEERTSNILTMEEKPTNPEVGEVREDAPQRGEANNNQEDEGNGIPTDSEESNNKEISESKTSKESREEKIKASLQEARGIYLLMGGESGMKKRMELIKALRKYKGNVDEALTLFRERVSSLGYKGIEKSMIPIVAAYGTTKDKVALIVNAHFDMIKEIWNKTPLLSRRKADEIKASVGKEGREEQVEFMNALSLYDALVFIYPDFYKDKYGYLSAAYQSTIYLQTYEWLGKAEELFNSFAPLVAEDKKAEFKALARNYNSYLQTFQRFGELDDKSGEGWVDKQREDCFGYADIITKEICTRKLSQLKATIEAIEDWAKDNRAEMFLTLELRDQIQTMKTTSIQELQSKYYLSHLQYMEARGETPTDADRKIAIFPEYNEVEREEKHYKYIYTKLDGYKKVYN